ncbi:MAG: LysR family transcriptional regulator, partial [Oscillospiraceae bacterium]
MERLNLRQLEIFSAVVDAGSFTAAAEKLYLAQSTVSDNVRALEELLHLKLFHRESKRRLTLTLEGKRVYRYAQDILGRCSALLLDVAVDSALELTLGASTVPAQSLLPGYMA